MSIAVTYAAVGAALFCLGLSGVINHTHFLRKIMALNIVGSGVFLVLVALAKRTPNGAPDPVPHAMVITGIVVAVAATALALVLMLKLASTSGSAQFPEDDGN